MSMKAARLKTTFLTKGSSERTMKPIESTNLDYLELLNFREDTDEGVQVGRILQVEIPANDFVNQTCLSEGKQQSLKVEDASVASPLNYTGLRISCSLQETPYSLRSASSMQESPDATGLIRKRSLLSRKNPHQRSDNLEPRTSIKTFLAPAESGENLLSLEPGPPKVLLVDDNSVQRLKMQARLTEACKWDPDIACNGAEAVQKYKDYSDLGFRYIAIFMDTTMPEMDGFAATKQMRSLELAHNYSKTRIIGTLGSFESAAETKCIDAGMNATGKA
jgi:CheY-like chemotaxis protein